MDSKKKIIVSVSAFIVVVMATVVAIVSVLAATNVRMSAGISVTYNVGDNVMLDVCVYTGVVEKNVTAAEFVDVSYTMDDGSIGYGNALDELTLNLPATTITATQYLVVRFEFYNVSAESYFDAELQVTSDSRLTCKYAENPFSGGAGGTLSLNSSATKLTCPSEEPINYYVFIEATDPRTGFEETLYFDWDITGHANP